MKCNKVPRARPFVLGLIARIAFIVLSLTCLMLLASNKPSLTPLPAQDYNWTLPPLVVHCKGASLRKWQVYRHFKFWENHGVEFVGFVYNFNCPAPCGEMSGAIVLTNFHCFPESEHTYAGTFQVYDKMTGEMKAAIIDIYEYLPGVVEHEIGHALGWGHTSVKPHLMNPNYQNFSWNTAGMYEIHPAGIFK